MNCSPVIFGTHQDNTLAQLADVASRAERAALMADGHLGYVMPIGGVAAYRNKASVVGVGFDIACGNAAILTDRMASHYAPAEWTELADAIQSAISFGVGLTCEDADAPSGHPLFESPAWDAVPAHAREGLRRKARKQLGTVGTDGRISNVALSSMNGGVRPTRKPPRQASTCWFARPRPSPPRRSARMSSRSTGSSCRWRWP